ncbi:VanZ family protein [Actinophytocola xanthii]|uniref:VanZ-like domain-containing protein n=1 Tax=Actinophytocola xanthii TaxID=1912961 RepID=A0A1Q8CQT4_9PSEU|nr:VanZ family protein [Actinophytocola xanthii]OLF16702.1 hypothetical protein BU204_15335 [Actinophytocola xanthii]
MITNFLLDNSALVPVVLVLAVVLCVGVGCVVLRSRRFAVRVLWVLVALSVLPVLALTLVPTRSRVESVACVIQFSAPTVGSVELLANVALFVPPVYFGALSTRRPLPTLVVAAVFSAAIETVQALIPAIGRACDTNDWAMNTAGAVVAAILAAATMAVTARATSRSEP